jgi:hypothetical protein
LLHGPKQLIVKSNKEPDEVGLHLKRNSDKNSDEARNASTIRKPKLLKELKQLKPSQIELRKQERKRSNVTYSDRRNKSLELEWIE